MSGSEPDPPTYTNTNTNTTQPTEEVSFLSFHHTIGDQGPAVGDHSRDARDANQRNLPVVQERR